MTDIRPIHHAEAEPFLQLLCDVFGLDFNRAHDIFFQEPLFDLNRKWALFEGPEILSILTTTPLEFGWGRATGIAGVATKKSRQGEGLATRLMEKVFRESERRGEGPALLFARETKLYEKNGFELIDRVVRGRIMPGGVDEDDRDISFPEIKALYSAWADGHNDRLRRDDQRWRYWQWHFRTCMDFLDGYVCAEPGIVREALYSTPVKSLPVLPGTEWFGTTFMADQLEIPFEGTPEVEMYLLGRNFPGIPQLFMTDQF